jgi:hypothetical protein
MRAIGLRIFPVLLLALAASLSSCAFICKKCPCKSSCAAKAQASMEEPMQRPASASEEMQGAEAELSQLIASGKEVGDRNVLHVIAYVDGVSDLVVQDGKASWHNREWAVPGRHEGADFPTLINGREWRPEWSSEGELREDQRSNSFELSRNIGSRVPAGDVSVRKGRGPVTVSATPPDGFVVTFDDGGFGGAEWYDVVIPLAPRD